MGDPRILVVDDHDALSRAGAALVADVIDDRPSASIVVATGRTPMGLYGELAGRVRDGRTDASRITVIQLDEYLGLAPNDRRSLFGWMRTSFLEPLSVADERVLRLPLDDDLDADHDAACAAFDLSLERRGGIDLAILGLGENGHLGFNEPPSEEGSPTRRVALTPATIEANARYWGTVADVPTEAVTLGLGTLLSARTILLMVSGASKRAIVRRALEGPTEPHVPASFLQTTHAQVTVIVDRAAWEGT
jgi:glucosamine-6-phosphate deaminase